MKTTHFVLGNKGQVGAAIEFVLNACEDHEVTGFDLAGPKTCPTKGSIDVMHVTIPYGDEFLNIVGKWRVVLKENGLIIVHSTVPVGTCDYLDAVHSPIRGIHPDLVGGITTFVKFFGGARAIEAAGYFAACGCQAFPFACARSVEAMKLWSTTQYGLSIATEKAIHAYCAELGLSFDVVYTLANITYNLGYSILGKTGVQRPVLEHVPGPVGGHCVEPNFRLLNVQHPFVVFAHHILTEDAPEITLFYTESFDDDLGVDFEADFDPENTNGED